MMKYFFLIIEPDILSNFKRYLKEANLTVNFKEFVFSQPQVKFLRHMVGTGSQDPDPHKIAAIQNIKVAKSKQALFFEIIMPS